MNAPAKFSTSQIRSDFLAFFEGRGHTIVPSAPLVPGNDPTLLFTNSGMVQFKDVFLGAEKRSYVRAADVQRCLRAGGKHNDLDSVGYTARHHTFFEMLGNWSFGDYFKKDAIAWAWELLTQIWKLPTDRLLVTVYHTDEEAFALWRDMIGIPESRIVRIGDNKGAPYASDNFWQMADTGPCGPCTEIFFDHGDHIAGGPPGSPDEDGDRFIEIWNLVFMQFDRQPDGTLVPLPAPCVDTGMGLERLAAILQHVHTNYEIDLFQALIGKASALTGITDLENKSLRVIADHIRACSFLIVDGVLPSNEGRGYVLRRIIRRALRHGWMLGVRQPFFSKMVPTLVELMGEAYPELVVAKDTVARALLAEEERFAETLDAGMKIFDEVASRSQDIIPGADAFRLYDTYGFPVDLTADIARERGMRVDMEGFECAMERQRETARAAGKFGGGVALPADLVASMSPTVFLGYEAYDADALRVVALLKQGRPVERAQAGDEVIVFTDRTPFYAESGGQVGDSGQLNGPGVLIEVADTQKFAGQFHGHVGRISEGTLALGDVLAGGIDVQRRGKTILNHSATHLLHAALREVLGTHVQQKGSLVAPDRLRFEWIPFVRARQVLPASFCPAPNRIGFSRLQIGGGLRLLAAPWMACPLGGRCPGPGCHLPLRPRLRSRRAASAICSVSSIRRFLIHRFLIRCLPSARRIQRLPQQSAMRCNRVCVQPMTRHPPCVSLSLPRGRRAPSRPRDGVRRNPPTLRRPRRWIYARSATVSSSKRRSNRRCVRQWRSTTRHWWAMGLHTRTSLRSANTRQR